jgi:hypothetical protein
MLKEDIITGNAFKTICDDYIDEDKPCISLASKPKTIFLKTDWIELFKAKVLPLIDYQFKLVTHNADRPAISGNLDLLEDNRLVTWYGMNIDTKHTKLQPIPIGIANEKWPHGDKDILLEIIKTNIDKRELVYSNFDIKTNIQTRSNISNVIREKKYIDIDNQIHNYKDYLTKLKSYKYVISPPGNSIDCHRIWESIYVGVVPIVQKHLALEYWYDLPILFIDSFNDLSEEYLNKQYNIIVNRSKKKTLMSYYRQLIK